MVLCVGGVAMTCPECGQTFTPKRSTSKVCSVKCAAARGSARARLITTTPIMDRVHRTIQIDADTGCWLWQASTRNGYAVTSRDGKNGYVHRFVADVFHGPCPQGHEVMHSCDVRRCVNPAHLSYGTRAENMADMVCKGRSTAGRPKPWLRTNHVECPVCGETFKSKLITSTGKRQVTCSPACRIALTGRDELGRLRPHGAA